MKPALAAACLTILGLAGVACTDNSGGTNPTGTAGTTGAAGTTGSGGATGSAGTTGGAGTTGAGGTTPGFMSVDPCAAESDYTTTGTTITFGALTDISYMPKCLKVAKGATVTFTGDFVSHPLQPSAKRGALTGNPITGTGSGTTASFTFPDAGYFAYFCDVHGASDGALGMVGVIWVQ